jgi:hypothetical protein
MLTLTALFKRYIESLLQNMFPTNLNILSARVKTTGVNQMKFQIELLEWHLIEGGRMRLERKNWMQYFERNATVMFIVSLAEYDQCLFENEAANRLHESLIAFNCLVESQ